MRSRQPLHRTIVHAPTIVHNRPGRLPQAGHSTFGTTAVNGHLTCYKAGRSAIGVVFRAWTAGPPLSLPLDPGPRPMRHGVARAGALVEL